jgi:hypothetical protein
VSAVCFEATSTALSSSLLKKTTTIATPRVMTVQAMQWATRSAKNPDQKTFVTVLGNADCII